VGQQTICSKARLAIGPVQDRVGPPQVDPASRSALRCGPAAPWMEDVTLEVWVDVEHSPILVRLAGTLNQATAINVVPVVKELIPDGGRDIELHTPGLEVPDPGGTEALVELQRLVQHSGGRFTWGGTLSELSVSDRSLR
jgi:hypothetical protein